MKLVNIVLGAGALALVLAAEPAAARPTSGQMGAESRGSVRISVSVMPRLDVHALLAGAAAPSTNLSGLRYSLVACDIECSHPFPSAAGSTSPAPPASPAQATESLVLVVPD